MYIKKADICVKKLLKEEGLYEYRTSDKAKKKARDKSRNRKEYIRIFNETYPGVNYCQKCGDNFHLQIHHIDKKSTDNHPLNIIKLCLVCHTDAHKGEAIHNLMVKRLKFLQE